LQLSEDELVQELTRIGGIPEDLYEDLVQRVIYDLKAVLIERVENLLHTARTNTSQNFKHAHIQMQEKIRNLYDSICVFEEGTSCFDDAVSANLKSYLLRTLCTDVAYTILSAMTGSNLSNTTSPKIRDECIANINSIDGRRSFTKLFLSLTGSDLNNFHSALLEVSAMNICSINLKLPDKKKRVELVETYASELERQLMSCEDAASGLLVALLLLIARNCNLAVHASGKFVSHLIAKVEMFQNVSANLFECLIKTQKYVILSLRQKNDELAPLMAENLKNLKDFILKK
uniref:E3 UFM1-protein ligase 1 homolog n=1 Tax=Dracunculus medinensis TaxID=318479 RepID=A0A0N4U0H1_DRAME